MSARVICSWCRRDMGPAEGCDADSHSICPDCADKARGEAGDPQPVRAALVELLRRKVRLGHVGSEAALRAVVDTPRFRREVLP